MIKTTKEFKIIASVLLVFLMIYILTLFFMPNTNIDANKTAVNVYFLNPATNRIESEVRYVDKSDNAVMAQSVLEALYAGPKTPGLVNVAPGNTAVLSGQIVNDTVLELEFSSDYYKLEPLDELFFRASLVWTMTELDFIKEVHIYVNGEELVSASGKVIGLLSRSNVIIDNKISPDKVDEQWVKLYFKDESGGWLVAENRLIEAADRSVEYEIVAEIINGPKGSRLLPTVLPDISLIDVRLDEGICYVNLSSDFLPKQAGKTSDFKLSVYSIVNSITENSKIKGVQFLIESEQIVLIYDNLDLAKPFSRDDSIILK